MQTGSSHSAGRFCARGLKAVSTLLVLGAALSAQPIQAAPFAYVTSIFSQDAVNVIDTANNTLADTISVGSLPTGLAVSPDGTRVYVGISDSKTVVVIDTASNEMVDPPIVMASAPNNIAVAPDGKHVYVTHGNADFVSVIDTTRNAVTSTIIVGNGGQRIAVTPDGKHIYVTNGSPTVSVIDLAANAVTATITMGSGALGIVMARDGKRAYLICGSDLCAIDTASNTVSPTIALRNGPPAPSPTGLAVAPDGKRVYVVDGATDSVLIVDTATGTLLPTVPAGDHLNDMAIAADGRHVYVTSGGHPGAVSVIDTYTNSMVATVPIADVPGAAVEIAMAPPPLGPFAYVTNRGDDTVSAIDTRTQRLVNTVMLPTGSKPTGIAVTPDGEYVYVADTGTSPGIVSVVKSRPTMTPSGTECIALIMLG